MKKILFSIVAILTIMGCSNDKVGEIIEDINPKEVTVTFDYSFWESGSMTKSTGNDLYTNFYNKYIKNKTLTPRSYSLILKNIKTGESSIIKGYWDKKEGIKLTEGTYEVTGTSSPKYKNLEKVDSVYLSFKENINIDKNTTSINLSAQYNSYMLILDADNTESIQYNFGTYDGSSGECINLTKVDNIYYMFINKLLNENNPAANRITINRNSGSISTVYLSKTPFKKGKYYYLNNITNSFDVPPMEEGN